MPLNLSSGALRVNIQDSSFVMLLIVMLAWVEIGDIQIFIMNNPFISSYS